MYSRPVKSSKDCQIWRRGKCILSAQKQHNQITENFSTFMPMDDDNKLLSDSELLKYSTDDSDEKFHQNNIDIVGDISLEVFFIILACFINVIIVAIIYICYHYKLGNVLGKTITNEIHSDDCRSYE